MSRRDAVQVVRSGARFLVSCHVRPDADALGSALGLAAILRTVGKEAEVFSENGVPESLHFLHGSDTVHASIPEGKFDAVFVTDTAARELLPKELANVAAPLVIVDHHAVHNLPGDVEMRETDAVATAEVVLRFMRDLGVEEVPTLAAQPLYAALVADTGGFRYAGTRPETLRLGAILLERGVDPWEVSSHLFERWQPARMSLLGEVLRAMELSREGRVALVVVDRALFERTGAADDMLEGMVNYGRMMEGVEVAALLWVPADASTVKLSLRSGGRIDVAKIAQSLGGGGHRSAAGASLGTDMAAARARLEAAIDAALASAASSQVPPRETSSS